MLKIKFSQIFTKWEFQKYFQTIDVSYYVYKFSSNEMLVKEKSYGSEDSSCPFGECYLKMFSSVSIFFNYAQFR